MTGALQLIRKYQKLRAEQKELLEQLNAIGNLEDEFQKLCLTKSVRMVVSKIAVDPHNVHYHIDTHDSPIILKRRYMSPVALLDTYNNVPLYYKSPEFDLSILSGTVEINIPLISKFRGLVLSLDPWTLEKVLDVFGNSLEDHKVLNVYLDKKKVGPEVDNRSGMVVMAKVFPNVRTLSFYREKNLMSLARDELKNLSLFTELTSLDLPLVRTSDFQAGVRFDSVTRLKMKFDLGMVSSPRAVERTDLEVIRHTCPSLRELRFEGNIRVDSTVLAVRRDFDVNIPQFFDQIVLQLYHADLKSLAREHHFREVPDFSDIWIRDGHDVPELPPALKERVVSDFETDFIL